MITQSELNKEQSDAFWSKVNIVKSTKDCWEWSGAKTPAGYGNVRINGSYKRSHRVAWELINFTIPVGYIVMHICDNPSCCNPHHLAISTRKTNSIDMLIKNRGSKHKIKHFGTKNVNAKLNDSKVLKIRELYKENMFNQYQLADMFNVTQTAIGCVVRNETWRHVL